MIANERPWIVAAVPTPIDATRRPDPGRFMEQCAWALEQGCHSLNILGSTGEASSLTEEDRTNLMMRAAAASIDHRRLIVGTGTPSLHATIELTRLAAELEFRAALILPPYYYKPVSDEGLFRYFEAIVQSMVKYNIDIYLYNYPQMTGISFSIELLEKLIKNFGDKIKGMKDSSGRLDYTRDAASLSDRFAVFPSNEVVLADAGAECFAGCISATVNLSAPLVRTLQQADSGTDPIVHEKLRYVRETLASVPLVPAVKYLIGQRENDPAWENTLPPLVALSDDQKERLKAVPNLIDGRTES